MGSVSEGNLRRNLPKPAKIDSFLIEKFLSTVLLEIKDFAGFGGWRQQTFQERWATIKIGIRILFKKGLNFVKKVLSVGKVEVL